MHCSRRKEHKGRHLSYPRTDCAKRTHERFMLKTDEDHHREDIPLTNLSTNLIHDFIVGNPLHLFDLSLIT